MMIGILKKEMEVEMFLVDDLLSKALDAIKEEIVDRRDVSRETVAHARKAMRRLAASLSETVAYLEGGLHTLERVADNKKAFSKSLSSLIDQEHLQRNCSESGVCEDLRLAQDELRELPKAVKLAKNKVTINELISQIDGYEQEFVKAVQEFLATSRKLDLTAVHDTEALDHQFVLDVLTKRIKKLNRIVQKIDDVIDTLRHRPV